MSPRPIPLNLMTVYADLRQSLEMGDIQAASIAVKTVKKKKYVYATTKDGSARIERYLGPADDPRVRAEVESLRNAAERAKSLRSTVTLLKAARLPSPSLILGRILEVVANAGLFERGMTLVGTAAYQTYAPILGYYLPTATYTTNDVDLSVAEFAPSENEEDFHDLLRRADNTFEPVWNMDDKLPKVFRASNGFKVELLTSFGRGRKSPVLVESIKAAAIPLSFQEYPAEETVNAVALYGDGVLVRVPTPARFAVHKLIVAQRRKPTERAKKQKDLKQAQELIDILIESDEQALQTELDGARERGRGWKTPINASLREIKRDVRQGRLPIPIRAQ
ncbi:MAG: GSU2403 family nucleotidyltransferase fold protein [Hyphomicrobiaceae bacterium]